MIGNKIPRTYELDRLPWDGQLFFRLPQGADLRRLSRLHAPAGKADLAALPQIRRPDLIQQA